MLSSDSTEWDEENWGDFDIGAIYCNADGEAVAYWTFEEESFLEKSIQGFEEAYMQIPHPFATGDIVRIVETDELGRARFCDAPDEQLVGTNYLDYSDTSVTVEILKENAEFEHEHIGPHMFE